uniref:Uncharacterized protein n=1 Tax=Setaria digitata TaxID=48799 RepID=A0A915PUI6_9BILA
MFVQPGQVIRISVWWWCDSTEAPVMLHGKVKWIMMAQTTPGAISDNKPVGLWPTKGHRRNPEMRTIILKPRPMCLPHNRFIMLS